VIIEANGGLETFDPNELLKERNKLRPVIPSHPQLGMALVSLTNRGVESLEVVNDIHGITFLESDTIGTRERSKNMDSIA